jgi:hypothetical protein
MSPGYEVFSGVRGKSRVAVKAVGACATATAVEVMTAAARTPPGSSPRASRREKVSCDGPPPAVAVPWIVSGGTSSPPRTRQRSTAGSLLVSVIAGSGLPGTRVKPGSRIAQPGERPAKMSERPIVRIPMPTPPPQASGKMAAAGMAMASAIRAIRVFLRSPGAARRDHETSMHPPLQRAVSVTARAAPGADGPRAEPGGAAPAGGRGRPSRRSRMGYQRLRRQ